MMYVMPFSAVSSWPLVSGAREAAINRAEGLRQSKILTSEAEKIQQINIAQGDS